MVVLTRLVSRDVSSMIDDDLGVVQTRGGQGGSNRHLAGPPQACFEAKLGVLR